MSKMKKYIILLMVITGITLSCQSETSQLTYGDGDAKIVYSIDETKEAVTSPTLIEEIDKDKLLEDFKTARDLNHLEDIKLFWINSDVYLEFYFNENAEKDDIQKSMDYFSTVVLSEKIFGYTYSIAELIKSKDMDNRIMKIYFDDQLVIKSRTKFEDTFLVEKHYFENHLMHLPFRETLSNSPLVETLKALDNNIEGIKITDAIKPFTIFITIEVQSDNINELENIALDYTRAIENNVRENNEELMESDITYLITVQNNNNILT